jgi:predicted DNA binding CopG/RHH family protein
MAKKQSVLSPHAKRVARNVEHMPDSSLDFDDAPELSDEEISRARRVGRPKTGHAKQLIAIRIEPMLLCQIRKMAAKVGTPYQTFIHDLLRRAVHKAA